VCVCEYLCASVYVCETKNNSRVGIFVCVCVCICLYVCMCGRICVYVCVTEKDNVPTYKRTKTVHTRAHPHTLNTKFKKGKSLQYSATHCNTLQHAATHYNTLQHTATHCNTLQHTATHCNTLQHTATHCITLQHDRNSTPHYTATTLKITATIPQYKKEEIYYMHEYTQYTHVQGWRSLIGSLVFIGHFPQK